MSLRPVRLICEVSTVFAGARSRASGNLELIVMFTHNSLKRGVGDLLV